MTRNRIAVGKHVLTCLAATLFFIGFPAQGTASSESAVGRGLGFAYEPAKEITVVGTIQGFVSPPALVSPLGLHLLISTGGKVVDAHLGPYLSSEDREALPAGQLVQIIGVNETVHGKKVLLARELIFNGRLVTIRNERGFLVRNSGPSHKRRDSRAAGNGGAQ